MAKIAIFFPKPTGRAEESPAAAALGSPATGRLSRPGKERKTARSLPRTQSRWWFGTREGGASRRRAEAAAQRGKRR
jgi:hypothetical protein